MSAIVEFVCFLTKFDGVSQHETQNILRIIGYSNFSFFIFYVLYEHLCLEIKCNDYVALKNHMFIKYTAEYRMIYAGAML